MRERCITLTTRKAACSCGKLNLTTQGEPVRVSACHCLACQRRTRSIFGAQARFTAETVGIDGQSTTYARTTDSGNQITFHFCPECGSTVYYHPSDNSDVIVVPVGAFADPEFPPPRMSVCESR
ncbi:MAG: GFA family protein [Phycisphaerales bacterium]|nr:MAG: GFA family protein [Phycisphaerales bacterium]